MHNRSTETVTVDRHRLPCGRQQGNPLPVGLDIASKRFQVTPSVCWQDEEARKKAEEEAAAKKKAEEEAAAKRKAEEVRYICTVGKYPGLVLVSCGGPGGGYQQLKSCCMRKQLRDSRSVALEKACLRAGRRAIQSEGQVPNASNQVPEKLHFCR